MSSWVDDRSRRSVITDSVEQDPLLSRVKNLVWRVLRISLSYLEPQTVKGE